MVAHLIPPRRHGGSARRELKSHQGDLLMVTASRRIPSCPSTCGFYFKRPDLGRIKLKVVPSAAWLTNST